MRKPTPGPICADRRGDPVGDVPGPEPGVDFAAPKVFVDFRSTAENMRQGLNERGAYFFPKFADGLQEVLDKGLKFSKRGGELLNRRPAFVVQGLDVEFSVH